ncbi:hypothetical protein BDN70DRAFT_877395 [Pholiota conissans]|uniref:Uncharacterized protein n=1 Tax=Pholiota conissans TaxID=109636 RepID=A0A9P5Z336_9AGAR|nr:hypothetical protein BDN70DRAFT_877395 [Pholiota conissans]
MSSSSSATRPISRKLCVCAIRKTAEQDGLPGIVITYTPTLILEHVTPSTPPVVPLSSRFLCVIPPTSPHHLQPPQTHKISARLRNAPQADSMQDRMHTTLLLWGFPLACVHSAAHESTSLRTMARGSRTSKALPSAVTNSTCSTVPMFRLFDKTLWDEVIEMANLSIRELVERGSHEGDVVPTRPLSTRPGLTHDSGRTG